MSAYKSGVAYDLPGHHYNPHDGAEAPRQSDQAYDVEHAYYHPDNANMMHYGVNPNVSDPHHPDYDPAIDPQLQLRSVRTAAESIAESHRSEARRDARRKKGRHKKGESVIHKLGRGLSLRRGLSTKKGTAASSSHVNEKSPLAGLVADEFGGPHRGGPVGAQGTGGIGISVPFDSAQQDHTPSTPAADKEPQQAPDATAASAGVTDLKGGKRKVAKRRQVYLNAPLPRFELKKNGDPKRIYPRNKVRTSKYTPLTFLPRFLYEQFRRIANVYFLVLIVLQIRSEFTAGATVPQIAMLPLVAILTITAIKDGIEDYRRHALDDEVNNSAATRLGGWRNVNQAKDPRNFLQKMLGLGGGRSPGKVTRGVRKLREQEDAIGMRNVSGKGPNAGSMPQSGLNLPTGSRPNTGNRPRTDSATSAPPGFRLETIVSESERLESDWGGATSMGKSGSQRNLLPPSAQLTPVSSNTGGRYANDLVDGVVDYGRATPGTARWERTLWKKLEVGDIVLLREDDQVPADIVILNTSDPDKNAYIETKNLDGETNLKVRKSLKCTSNIQSEEDIEHSRFLIDSEPPHANLYAYNGLLKYTVKGETSPYEYAKEAPPDSSAAAAQDAQSTKVEPVTINELLLRGCSLRNTDWIIGMVLFTGEDTKIMLNGGETPSKRSKIEKETNFNVMMNFVLLFIMCLVCAIIGGVYLGRTDTSRYWYERNSLYASSTVANAVIIFFSCMVVFQNIVPISLYISIEIVKTIQAFFIFQDVDMYYEPLDYPCMPKTWNISDDLGQIEYIFSDKTGTLTQNVMEFKKCSINGVTYGEGITEAMIGAMRRQGKDMSGLDPETQERQLQQSKEAMAQTMMRAFKNRFLRQDKMTLISPSLANDLTTSAPQGAEQRKNIVTFFRALAICHTALADRPDANDPFTLDYKAQSPDEAALVAAARDVGAVFLNKNNQTIDVEVMGKPERYTPLAVLEFNSTRKRMSTIVREPEGRILMITKGADSVIYERLREDHPAELKDVTTRDLEDFANAGLRTLCIAYRYLEESEYLEWSKIHEEAAAALADRDELVDEAAEKIEVGLTLLGATALEDKLQVGVPDAIATLHKAGIKLWILTGDKLQTAIEIGFSCNLLTSDMEIMIVSSDHMQGTRAQIEAACNKIAAAGRPILINGKKSKLFGRKSDPSFKMEPTDTGKAGFAVVIDGETLKWALSNELKPLFLALTTQCEAVVCCRVSPAQKALTVKLVKEGMNAMTLAIGDGANDVAMIQEAHIGVGIAGLEGAQASMSADYAIGQFRYLTKLLLVHGHWSVVRISKMHVVFFFKNILWTCTLFFFQLFTEFDATYLYDYTSILLFNLVYSSLPVIILGALDQDVNAKALLAVPETYRKGITGAYYTRTIFWMAVVDAVYQGAVCFFIPWAMWSYFPATSSEGYDLGSLWLYGTTIGAAAVISANVIAGMATSYWTWIFWVVEIGSMLSYFAWISIYSAFPGISYTSVAYYLFGTVLFWATILLVIIICMLPRYAWQAYQSCFHPSDCDIIREQWIAGDLKDRLGLGHRKAKKNRRTQHVADMEEQPYSNTAMSPMAKRFRELSEDTQDSSDPLAGGYADDRSVAPRHRQTAQHPDAGQAQSLQPLQAGMSRSGTAMSYYDPDLLSSTSPQSPERNDRGQQHFNVPAINVQRASDTSFGGETPSQKGGFNPYGAYGGGATSQTALNQSVDSFEQHFNQAFGPQSQWREAAAAPVIAPNPAERYHDRFRKSPLSQEEVTPTQTNVHLPFQQHPRDVSGMSDVSFHTASGSHAER